MIKNSTMTKSNQNPKGLFEGIKQSDDEMGDFWSARDLQKILGYTRWEGFSHVIDRAKQSFLTSKVTNNSNINHHFRQVVKLFSAGKGAQQPGQDYMLSQYACYLIAQNADPRKKAVALAQSYFNIQTRRQELNDQAARDQVRLDRRKEFSTSDKRLSENILEAGVSARYGGN